jgi:PERQ amino acid-rich with GYF domain-containing protein
MSKFRANGRQIFSGDVNSTIKPPPQNTHKDPNAHGANGRKTSISQGSNTFGLSSPASSSRPSTRRQQTADSSLASPVGNRFSREESPFFSRKFNDTKDGADDRAEDTKSTLPFGGLMRANTVGSALGNGPASPWGPGPASATMSPMGNFGSFAFGGSSANPPTPSEKRPGFGSMRGESRLAQLMPKDSSEDLSAKPAERPWRPRQRTDTDPFADEPPAGRAALGGGQDDSPPSNPSRRAPRVDTPIRGASSDFGMSEVPGFRDALHRGQSHQTPQGHRGEHEPLSPSDTNPYRSPPDDRHDADDGSYDGESLQHSRVQGLGGIPEHGPNSFGNLPRGFGNAAFDGSDRSQTSSVGGTKGFAALGGLPTLSNLGGMGGWPTSGNPIGTPDRENRPGFQGAFGNSLFGSMGELQSPSLGGLAGMFGPSSSGNLSGTAGRGSKLGSLFPAAMQAQMQGGDNDNAEGGDMRQSSAFGAIGRNAFTPTRDTDSPMRTGRNAFEDFPQTDTSRSQGPFSSVESAQGQTATAFPQASSAQSNYQQSQGSSDSASNQLPTAQQRMMVMPDRMRWVYLDPQGQVQGPWSGLEMHDWYKASFFTADLSVKKVEDTEFEPLGQLIRRIGNSREPFLVPQIGIPHGPPTTQAGAPFTPAAAAPGSAAAQPGSVQPPFAGAFPSFGTTLTAEQQNNLERRKQEEQYLMARQREFLAQQQVNMKQMQMSGLPAALHHHSSAHSLQSQPSFGSMTSPIGMPPQPPIPGVQGFFDGPSRQTTTQGIPTDFFREDELARLSLQERQQLFGVAAPGPQQPSHAQQIAAMFGQQSDAQREEARMEQLRHNEPDFKARLREFEQLREEHDAEEAAQAAGNMSNDPIGPPQQEQHQQEEPEEPEEEEKPNSKQPEVLSLTQQVQKAASAKPSPISATQPESHWGKVNTSLPMPFPPPPQSTTPLPAPTAQRGRSNLPEALNIESRSRSETPEVSATPSIAPWAKETVEAPKGPPLKEIQEAEAKHAAKVAEQEAAARKRLREQEMKALASQAAAPAPGLPTTSTWGSGASPVTPSSVPSAWSKPATSKAPATSNVATASKVKTLADIQREEELRKQKTAAAAAAAQPPPGISGGKRYADLASKQAAAGPPTGSAWSTVGAGGKVKIPTGPAAAAPPAVRAASSAIIPTTSSARVAPRPGTAVRSVTASGQTRIAAANEEFTKWAKGALAKGLNSDINGLYSRSWYSLG